MTVYNMISKIIKKSNKLFFIYFISFFLVILTPILLLSFSSYNLVVSSVQQEISRANMNALRQTNSTVDRLLNEINTLSIQLGLDGRIFAASRSPENSFLLNDVKDRIKRLATEHLNVYMIQLYFKHNNQIISSEGADHVYDQHEFDQWISKMEETSSNDIWLPVRSLTNQDGNTIRILTLVRKIPVAFDETMGYVAIHLYEDGLLAPLKTMNPNKELNIYLTTTSGEVISAHTPATSLEPRMNLSDLSERLQSGQEGSVTAQSGDQKVMLSCSQPNTYGWILVSETPLNHLYLNLQNVKQIIIVTDMILIVLGLLISYYLSRTMYNPIKQLFEKSKRYQQELSLTVDGEEGTLKYVNGLFERVVGQHKALEASYKANYQAMVDRFIFTVLYNRFTDAFKIDEKIAYLKLPITTQGYSVLVVEIDHYSEMMEQYSPEDLNLFRFALNNIVQEVVGETFNCLSTEINDDQIAVLINTLEMNDELNQKLKGLGEQIIHAVKSYLKLSVTVSIGEFTDHITQAHLSFNQAIDVIRYKVLLGYNKVILFSDVNQEKSINYFYPVQLEKSIINNIQAGNQEKVIQGLNTLKDEINEQPMLSHENVFRIYNRLLDAAIDVILQANMSLEEVFGSACNVHEELAKRETVESISDWLENVFMTLMKALRHNTPHHAKVEQAIHYMKLHYHQDLSVDAIAEAVELNPAYLSRIFKQTTGKTVLEFLTLIRLDESKTLLIHSKDNIHDIAQKVGYNNTNSFIRFFRKYEGITPGEFRKTRQTNQEYA